QAENGDPIARLDAGADQAAGDLRADRPQLAIGDGGRSPVASELQRDAGLPGRRIEHQLAHRVRLFAPDCLYLRQLRLSYPVPGRCGARLHCGTPVGALTARGGVAPRVGHQPKRPSTASAAGRSTGRRITMLSRIATATPTPYWRTLIRSVVANGISAAADTSPAPVA